MGPLTTSLALQPHKTDKETASVVKFIAAQHANFDVDDKSAWLVCETFHRDLRDEMARLPPLQKVLVLYFILRVVVAPTTRSFKNHNQTGTS